MARRKERGETNPQRRTPVHVNGYRTRDEQLEALGSALMDEKQKVAEETARANNAQTRAITAGNRLMWSEIGSQRLQHQVDELTTQNTALQAHLTASAEQNAVLIDQVARQDDKITEKDQAIAEKDARIAYLERLHAERVGEIEGRNTRIAALVDQLATATNRAATLESNSDRIARREALLASHSNDLARLYQMRRDRVAPEEVEELVRSKVNQAVQATVDKWRDERSQAAKREASLTEALDTQSRAYTQLVFILTQMSRILMVIESDPHTVYQKGAEQAHGLINHHIEFPTEDIPLVEKWWEDLITSVRTSKELSDYQEEHPELLDPSQPPPLDYEVSLLSSLSELLHGDSHVRPN